MIRSAKWRRFATLNVTPDARKRIGYPTVVKCSTTGNGVVEMVPKLLPPLIVRGSTEAVSMGFDRIPLNEEKVQVWGLDSSVKTKDRRSPAAR